MRFLRDILNFFYRTGFTVQIGQPNLGILFYQVNAPLRICGFLTLCLPASRASWQRRREPAQGGRQRVSSRPNPCRVFPFFVAVS
jgi:hypothetical protein